MLSCALNHMTVPTATTGDFIRLAQRLGVVGIEVRCDLATFAGSDDDLRATGAGASAAGLKVLALAQIDKFDDMSATRLTQAHEVMRMAVLCGADGVVLIPQNDGTVQNNIAGLRDALGKLATPLRSLGLKGFIEPLGFATSALRDKAAIVSLIDTIDVGDVFMLVHDTFHHYLAGGVADGAPVFARHTGLVHISGVTRDLAATDLCDADRGLVDDRDRLGNLAQMRALLRGGYRGAFSMEAFAPEIHALGDPMPALAQSFEFIAQHAAVQAA